MNIYLLQRDNNKVGYDEYEGFVIAATSPVEARQVANDRSADEGKIWTDPDEVEVTKVGENNYESPCIILSSFRAG